MAKWHVPFLHTLNYRRCGNYLIAHAHAHECAANLATESRGGSMCAKQLISCRFANVARPRHPTQVRNTYTNVHARVCNWNVNAHKRTNVNKCESSSSLFSSAVLLPWSVASVAYYNLKWQRWQRQSTRVMKCTHNYLRLMACNMFNQKLYTQPVQFRTQRCDRSIVVRSFVWGVTQTILI